MVFFKEILKIWKVLLTLALIESAIAMIIYYHISNVYNRQMIIQDYFIAEYGLSKLPNPVRMSEGALSKGLYPHLEQAIKIINDAAGVQLLYIDTQVMTDKNYEESDILSAGYDNISVIYIAKENMDMLTLANAHVQMDCYESEDGSADMNRKAMGISPSDIWVGDFTTNGTEKAYRTSGIYAIPVNMSYDMTTLLVHELLHTLGMDHVVILGESTIMHPYSNVASNGLHAYEKLILRTLYHDYIQKSNQ